MSEKPFQENIPTYPSDASDTPYQRAQQTWDTRIGHAQVQARNWRLVALASLLLAAASLALLCWQLSTSKLKVFVAEISHAGRVVNVAPLQRHYTPNQAQITYFLGQFVQDMRALPLDPVVAKQNWLRAYSFLTQHGSHLFNEDMRKSAPQKLLGQKTVVVKVQDINPISDHTYSIDWQETSTDLNNKHVSTVDYNGVFTLHFSTPGSQAQIMKNPLGLFISDFHFSTRNDNHAT
ncbi:MAG: conjugal transfer protein TrbF [marine bacterium B5-7]|nr:MAG: conjugal transfer protein TrbF [marine bacterium B5-7]